MLKKIIVIFIVTAVFIFKATAQPFTFDNKLKPKEIPIYPISKTDKSKGKMGIAEVIQVKDTAYYFCKGMGIYNPMVVKLVAKDKNAPVKVSLHKWNWKEASRSGITKKGDYTESFVTEGSFGIKVIAPAKRPCKYTIYLHIAKEAPPKLPSAFKTTKKK